MLDKENLRQWILDEGGEESFSGLKDLQRVELGLKYLELYNRLFGTFPDLKVGKIDINEGLFQGAGN